MKGTVSVAREAASQREAPPSRSLPKSGWRSGDALLLAWFRLKVGAFSCCLVVVTAAVRAAATCQRWAPHSWMSDRAKVSKGRSQSPLAVPTGTESPLAPSAEGVVSRRLTEDKPLNSDFIPVAFIPSSPPSAARMVEDIPSRKTRVQPPFPFGVRTLVFIFLSYAASASLFFFSSFSCMTSKALFSCGSARSPSSYMPLSPSGSAISTSGVMPILCTAFPLGV